MQLKIYQENAIEELLEKSKKLLAYSGSKKLVFKSPTGSGKTIMMAEFLKQLVDDREIKQPLSFIWTAPRHLHEQSRKKLENYFEESRALKCSFFEDLDDRKIGENEILFFNWESINKSDNVYIRDNEQDFNLSNVIERTKEEGREIILVIDECHHHATSEISKRLIEDIAPKLTIEVSATPVVENPDEFETVQLEDVKAEGMIKKVVIINEGIGNFLKQDKIISELSTGSEEMVLDLAIRKRQELVKGYKKEDAEINPLILVQLPDKKSNIEDEVKDRVIKYLRDKHNISIENGKLAIWLSGEHINKENVEKANSEVEVLIFKQAIALGWDCPRAQILVLFRFWKSLIFSIQTVGRIMRMPELKHYENRPVLNFAYVYTNLENIEIQEDIAKDYITVFTSSRIENYQPINLTSCYSERHREKTRLAPLFINIFLEIAEKEKLKNKIKVKAEKLDQNLIAKAKIEDIDIKGKLPIVAEERIKYTTKYLDLQKLFDYFARESLSPEFYPEERSIGRIKESIYRFFGKEFALTYDDEEKIVSIVLDEKNIDKFKTIINLSKEKYIEGVSVREKELNSIDNWNVPEVVGFNINYYRSDKNRSVIQPFYISDNPNIFTGIEKKFIEFLERQDNIEWWFKNGDRDKTFFAVPYEENNEPKPFYVDFIVQLKDGRIGLFDTKAGLTQKVAGPKIEGLYKYIQNENKKGKNFFGGIVTNTDQRNYKGRWIYFYGQSKDLKDNDLSNWKNLEY